MLQNLRPTHVAPSVAYSDTNYAELSVGLPVEGRFEHYFASTPLHYFQHLTANPAVYVIENLTDYLTYCLADE